MAGTDKNIALDKATDFFWRSGYGGSTMRQLQTALDMRPGSIYAAFGDKNGLYLKAIERYTDRTVLAMQTAMAGAMSAESGLNMTLQGAIFGNSDSPTDLCFLMKTINELETRQPELVEAAKEALLRVRQEIARQIGLVLLEKGHTAEDVESSAEELAITVQAQVMGLKAQLKVDGDSNAIEMSLKAFLSAVFTA